MAPAKICGYWSKICSIDLTQQSVCFQDIPAENYRRVLSGLGLGVTYLSTVMTPGVNPLGPENVIGFVTGLLTDTGSLFSGRYLVVAKSPASNGWSESNCGGYFSPFLKRCGIDGLFVRGQAQTPVYILLSNDRAEIIACADLWGKDTHETESELKRKFGKSAQIACIGLAGEKLSHMAGICTDGGRMAGRSGLGAVMGSKLLKAVVVTGNKRVPVANPAKVKLLSNEFRGRLKQYGFIKNYMNDGILTLAGKATQLPIGIRQPSVVWRAMLSKYGTCSMVAMSSESGDSPVKNWSGSIHDFPKSKYGNISGDQIIKFETKKYGCYSCPLRCGGTVEPSAGLVFPKMHKPEYETICAFGNLVMNDDLQSVFELNDMVNRAGMDSISCGGVLAFACECFESGILTKQDFEGLEPSWGNAKALVSLTKKIIAREGIGDILADGVKKASELIGKNSQKFAVHCGGVEAPMHDSKFDPGFATAYSAEPTPARHTTTGLQYLEIQHLERKFSKAVPLHLFNKTESKYIPHGKGEALAVCTFYKMLIDGAGLCLFGTQIGGDIPVCEWLNSVTGWEFDPDDYLLMGERIAQLRHLFNIREGLNPIYDFAPNKRMIDGSELQEGPLKARTLELNQWITNYFTAMHWDPLTALPDEKHLMQLELPITTNADATEEKIK